MAIAYTVLVSSIGILDGGLIGIALIVDYLSEWNLGVIYFFLNAPVLWWVFKVDKTLFKNSLFGMVFFSGNTFLLELLSIQLPLNFYLTLVFSALVLGVCFQTMSELKASFGGISPIAVKLDEWSIMKLSKFYFLTDVLVLLMGMLIFGVVNFIYSFLFVSILAFGVEMTARLRKWQQQKVLVKQYGTT